MKSPKSNRKANIQSSERRKITVNKLIILGLLVLSVGLIFGSGRLFFSGSGLKTNAQSIKTDNKTISSEALQQIGALIQEKESRSESQQKIDSRLLYKLRMERGEAIADGVPTLDTGLQVDGNGFIAVEITAYVNDELLTVLKKMNAETIAVVPQYRSITARVPISEIEGLAARPEIIFIQPQMEMMTSQAVKSPARSSLLKNLDEYGAADFLLHRQIPDFQTRAQNVREFLTARLGDDQLTGTVTSQADTTHRAALSRSLASVTGAGLKIGVLSNGVNTLAARQASGDLPATVTVLPGQAGSGDEGTAMLELIYDLAPGAQLFYATGLP